MTDDLHARIEAGRQKATKDSLKSRISQQQREPDLLEKASEVSLTLAHGLTFGFSDELTAGVRAMWEQRPEEDYTDAYLRIRDRARKQMQQFKQRSPGAALATEIAGGLLLPGSAGAKFASKGTTLLDRAARSSLVGGFYGSAYGAGQAATISDIPSEAISGGVTGAVIGGALPIAGEAVKRTGKAIYAAAQPSRAATGRISQAMRRDEMTPDQLMAALDEAKTLGRPATIADVGGESLLRELEISAQTPGKAAQVVEEFLSTRNKEMLNRLSKDILKGSGARSDDVLDAIEKTMQIRSKAAKPIYEKAMQFSAELNDDIVETWKKSIKTPLGKQALGKARKILNVEDFNEAPLMEKIDAFKRGLDDVIGGAKRKGENAIAAKALKMKHELVDMVDTINPDYKRARQIWENSSNYLGAIERGREVLKPSFTAAKLKQEFSELTGPEQEAFKIGVVDSVITRMRQQSAKEPNLLKIIRSPEIKDKLKAIMSKEQAEAFEKVMDIEEKMFRVASQARAGSPTMRRQAALLEQEKQLSALRGLDAVIELAISPLRTVFTRALPAIPRAMRDTLLSKQNAIIADRLLRSDTDELLKISREFGQMRIPEGAISGALIPPAVIAKESE